MDTDGHRFAAYCGTEAHLTGKENFLDGVCINPATRDLWFNCFNRRIQVYRK
jgi:hypothetical protein